MIGAEITEYFGKSLYNSLWLAIAENRLEDAIKEIESHKTKDGSLFKLFSKSNPIIKTASFAFSSKALNTFSYRRLFINEDDIKEFNDLIRLLVAIHLNGSLKPMRKFY